MQTQWKCAGCWEEWTDSFCAPSLSLLCLLRLAVTPMLGAGSSVAMVAACQWAGEETLDALCVCRGQQWPPVKGCFISPPLFDSGAPLSGLILSPPLPPRLSYDKAPPMAFTLAQCYGATGQPLAPSRQSCTSPPHCFHRNPVSNHAAPATASASVKLPLPPLFTPNQFRFISVSVARRGVGGCCRGRCFTSNLPPTRCAYHLMSRCKRKLLFFGGFFFTNHISEVKTCLSFLSSS